MQSLRSTAKLSLIFQRSFCCKKPRPARGFTLVELLVVIAIFGILVGLLLPAIQSVRESARRTQCLNNLRQLCQAAINYESSHRHFPSGFETPHQLMWSGMILPYIDQGVVFESIDLQGDTSRWSVSRGGIQANEDALGVVMPIFQCPSSGVPTSQRDPLMDCERVPSCYLACCSGLLNRESGAKPWAGLARRDGFPASDGFFYENSRRRGSDILDGLSNTLMIGEAIPNQDFWGDDYSGNPQKVDHWTIGSMEIGDGYKDLGSKSGEISECLGSTACPMNAVFDNASPINDKELCFASFHPAGANLGFGDGSTRFVTEEIDAAVYSAIGTRRGRELDHAVE